MFSSDNKNLFRERIEYIRRDVIGQGNRRKVLLQVRRFFVYGKGNPLSDEFKPSYCMLMLILQNFMDLKEKKYICPRPHNYILNDEY